MISNTSERCRRFQLIQTAIPSPLVANSVRNTSQDLRQWAECRHLILQRYGCTDDYNHELPSAAYRPQPN